MLKEEREARASSTRMQRTSSGSDWADRATAVEAIRYDDVTMRDDPCDAWQIDQGDLATVPSPWGIKQELSIVEDPSESQVRISCSLLQGTTAAPLSMYFTLTPYRCPRSLSPSIVLEQRSVRLPHMDLAALERFVN